MYFQNMVIFDGDGDALVQTNQGLTFDSVAIIFCFESPYCSYYCFYHPVPMISNYINQHQTTIKSLSKKTICSSGSAPPSAVPERCLVSWWCFWEFNLACWMQLGGILLTLQMRCSFRVFFFGGDFRGETGIVMGLEWNYNGMILDDNGMIRGLPLPLYIMGLQEDFFLLSTGAKYL